MSKFLTEKAIHKSTTEISKSDEIFLKEFSMNFYQKIIDINNFNIFENILNEWIKSIDKEMELVFELMQNHKQTQFWFSSIIGFFYQLGISCNVDKNKALELYLLAIDNGKEEFFNQNLHLSEGNDNEFGTLQYN